MDDAEYVDAFERLLCPVCDYRFHIKIEDIKLTVRAYNALTNDDIAYVGDLVQMTDAELLCYSNFGRVSLKSVKDALAEIGLHLGIKVPEWESMRHSERQVKDLARASAERIYHEQYYKFINAAMLLTPSTIAIRPTYK